MAYVNRPYGGNYYEAEREVIREAPYGGAYGAEYRVDEFGNRIHHHHHSVPNLAVGEYGHHHNQYARPTEIIERTEERIVDNAAYDPYRRIY